MSNYNINKIAEAVQKDLGAVLCPHCQTKKVLNDGLYSLPFKSDGQYHDLSSYEAVPYFALTCENCGHTDFFNPKTYGLI